MTFQFISLEPDPPEGFEYKQPTKRDLLSNLVAVYAADLNTAMETLAELTGRVQGAVITPAESFSFSELWPGLWHLQANITAGLPLQDTLELLFESMNRTRETMDLCNTLKVDLNRSRVSQQQTQQSYNENIERLGRKVEDLRQEIEHRRQSEEALRQSEEKLQTTLNSIGDAVIATDINGRVMRMNPVAEQLTGWTLDEARDRDLAEVFRINSAKTHQPVDNPVAQVINTGEIVDLANHTVLSSREGGEFHIADSAAPIRSPEGEVSGVVLVFRDVSAEYHLREQLRELALIVEQAAEGIVTIDLDRQVRYANRAWAEMHGYDDTADLIGGSIDKFHSSDQLETYVRPFFKRVEEEAYNIGELWHTGIDGRKFPTSMSANLLHDDQGQPYAIAAFAQDTTASKQVELSIKAGQARARQQRTAIATLAVDPAITGGDIAAAVHRVTEVLTGVVQVARASVWRFSDDDTALHCVDLFNADTGEHSSGTILRTADFPAYFETLRLDSRISASNARIHPATRAFTEKYLDPIGITSMLDAGINTEGRLTGVVCLEHTGEIRDWHSDEEAFASTIASLMSLTIANARRIQANEEADRTLALIEATLESTDNGIVVLDSDNNLIVHNRTFLEIWGATAAQVSTRNIEDLHAHIATIIKDAASMDRAAQAIKADPDSEITDIVELKDGRVFEFFTRPMSFDVLSDGRVWSFRDITKQTQSARDIQHLRNYLSNIIDSMPSILIGMDSSFLVTQWNRMAEIATGIPPQQALGQPLGHVVPRLIPEMDRIRRALDSGHVRYDPKQPRRDSRGVVYEDITIYPLVANGVEGAVIRIDDVTEHVRLEEMMIQSEKMLSVGGLAAGMAHEINNPLAGLLQSANNVIRRLTDQELTANLQAAERAGLTMETLHAYMEDRRILQLLEVIKDSGTRMAVIVENMLSFARKSDSSPGLHDPVLLLEKTLELAATDYDLKKKYDFKAIEIEKHFAAGLPEISCEGSKIQQVLLNILRNGAHAMHEERLRRRRLKIESPPSRFVLSLSLEENREMLRIEIADNGPGMDEDRRRRVFEPFFTTKPVGEGTGLGLSVSYFIITENHCGTLSVESEPDQGANFIIRLPVNPPSYLGPARP